jgi:hypothetical protein
MSASSQLRLKQPSGWFAAGNEVEDAIGFLSDGAFRLFMWICLHADRRRGSIRASTSGLTRTLGRGKDQIATALDELVRKRVCILYIDGVIEIADRFWPYQRACHSASVTDPADYVCQVKRMFLERRCVRSIFTAADEQLAAELHRMGIPIVDVERAILLGCLRKYVALLNNGGGTPITSLHYFRNLLNEAGQKISPDYWSYVAHKIQVLERRWNGFEKPPAGETK